MTVCLSLYIYSITQKRINVFWSSLFFDKFSIFSVPYLNRKHGTHMKSTRSVCLSQPFNFWTIWAIKMKFSIVIVSGGPTIDSGYKNKKIILLRVLEGGKGQRFSWSRRVEYQMKAKNSNLNMQIFYYY